MKQYEIKSKHKLKRDIKSIDFHKSDYLFTNVGQMANFKQRKV